MAVVEQEKQKTELVERQSRTPIISGNRGLELRNIEDMYRFAQYVVNSGFAPKGMEKPESILVAMQMGFEIGLSPLQAIQNIAIINNRPSVWGDAVKGLVLATGECEDFREWFEGDGDKTVAYCAIKRRGFSEVVRSFSYADAKMAELASKPGPWKQYPKRMLQMRARSWACRDTFPDALKGLYVAEEAHDMEPIDVTPARPAREVASIDAARITNGQAPTPENAKAQATNSPQPRTTDGDERNLLISRVNKLLLDLPSQEIRDEIISAARKETGSKNNNWEKWDTAAIQKLGDGLEVIGA